MHNVHASHHSLVVSCRSDFAFTAGFIFQFTHPLKNLNINAQNGFHGYNKQNVHHDNQTLPPINGAPTSARTGRFDLLH